MVGFTVCDNCPLFTYETTSSSCTQPSPGCCLNASTKKSPNPFTPEAAMLAVAYIRWVFFWLSCLGDGVLRSRHPQTDTIRRFPSACFEFQLRSHNNEPLLVYATYMARTRLFLGGSCQLFCRVFIREGRNLLGLGVRH